MEKPLRQIIFLFFFFIHLSLTLSPAADLSPLVISFNTSLLLSPFFLYLHSLQFPPTSPTAYPFWFSFPSCITISSALYVCDRPQCLATQSPWVKTKRTKCLGRRLMNTDVTGSLLLTSIPPHSTVSSVIKTGLSINPLLHSEVQGIAVSSPGSITSEYFHANDDVLN